MKSSCCNNARRAQYLKFLLQERQKLLSHQLVAERLGKRSDITATGRDAGEKRRQVHNEDKNTVVCTRKNGDRGQITARIGGSRGSWRNLINSRSMKTFSATGPTARARMVAACWKETDTITRTTWAASIDLLQASSASPEIVPDERRG